MNNSVM